MKKLSLLFILLACSLIINAQDKITGKWYAFSDYKGVEIQFYNDSLVAKRIKSDFTFDTIEDLKSLKTFKVIHANNNYYYIEQKESYDELDIGVFKIIEPGKRIVVIANYKEKFNDMESVEKYIAADTNKKYGINLYNENEFQKIKTFPEIKTITKEDFKKFLSICLDLKNQCDTLHKESFKALSLRTYQKAKINDIAIGLGYSPYFYDEDIDNLKDKYESFPEFKVLIDALNKQKHYRDESPDWQIKKE